MSQTVILDETYEDFNYDTGNVKRSTKHKVTKNQLEPTDEFIKVSKYLNTIFAFKGIPLSLVPISLLCAQEMEFKTNIIYLLKDRKTLFAEMLGISLDRVNKLIKECQKYDILRPRARGVYEVNSYLFSTGNAVETRNLQAHFDYEADSFVVQADQRNLINGTVIRKAVANKKNMQIPGQMSLFDKETGGTEEK